MAESKKYYWLKLKRDFFKRHDIRIIEEMPNGKDYILFYLKLLLESVDHEGTLRFSDTVPYNEQMLSVVTNTNVDIVRAALKLFMELHMIDIFDDQTIYMSEVDKYLGSETQWAEKKRLQRTKEDNVLTLSSNCPIEREKEQKKEKNKEKDTHSFILSVADESDWSQPVENSARESDSDDSITVNERDKRVRIRGILGGGLVMLSEAEKEDLLKKLSIDEFDKYVEIVKFCEAEGKSFKKKTHYQAILDMAMADRKKGKSV